MRASKSGSHIIRLQHPLRYPLLFLLAVFSGPVSTLFAQQENEVIISPEAALTSSAEMAAPPTLNRPDTPSNTELSATRPMPLPVAQAGSLPPPLPVAETALEYSSEIDLRARLDAAEVSAKMGFTNLALNTYSEIASRAINPQLRDEALLGVCVNALALNRPKQANAALQAGAAWREQAMGRLLRSMINFQEGDFAAANLVFSMVAAQDISEDFRAWYYWQAGLLAEVDGDYAEAIRQFTEARRFLKNPAQLAQIELAMFKSGILSDESDAETIRKLRIRLETSTGGQLGFQIAGLLAAGLAKNGQLEEALALLNEQVLLVSAEQPDVRGRLLLIKAIIAGPDTEQGRRALESLALQGASRRYVQLALAQLSRNQSKDKPDGSFLQLLNQLEQDPNNQEYKDLVLLLRAQWHKLAGNLELSERDATRLLEQFPASDLVGLSLRLRAQLALLYQPPQYRTAAKYLLDLRQRIINPAERSRLSAWVADCYFLNGDYQSAASTYAQAVEDAPPRTDTSLYRYQQLIALMQIKEFEAVMEVLAKDQALDLTMRWKLEWNLASGLREQGRALAALRRLEDILNNETLNKTTEPELKLRLQWLSAQLSMTLRTEQELARVPDKCDALLATLTNLPEKTISTELDTAIRSRTLMLKGQALLNLRRIQEGLTLLDDLSKNYPESDAAILARLIAARSLAQAGQIVEAQQRMKDLADTFPDNPYAPVALYEAALQAQKRELEATYRTANDLLNDLQQRYPGHELAYYAKLEQGDILRQLNEFEVAERIYQQALQEKPQHPAKARTELALADSLAAQSGNPQKRLAAQDIYERMFELPDYAPDIRAEAGYKWALTVKAGGSLPEEEAFWRVLQLLWLEARPESTNASTGTGRGSYWLARAGLELAGIWERKQQYSEAVHLYQQMLDAAFPGESLIRERLSRLTQAR